MLTSKEAYELGHKHGAEMARESGSADAGCEGWDGMLINADPQFVREQFGWDGCDSSDAAKDLLSEYCRGAQAGANSETQGEISDPFVPRPAPPLTAIERAELEASRG